MTPLPVSSKFGPNFTDAKNSSRCSIVGINGKIDPPSEYDEVDEEVIYSQESPNMEVEDQVPRNWVYCQRYPFIPITEETILSRIYV